MSDLPGVGPDADVLRGQRPGSRLGARQELAAPAGTSLGVKPLGGRGVYLGIIPRCSPGDTRGSTAEQTCPLTPPGISFMGYRATLSSLALPRDREPVKSRMEPR